MNDWDEFLRVDEPNAPPPIAARAPAHVAGVATNRRAAIALWQRKLDDPRTSVGVREMARRALANLTALMGTDSP